jgi:NodT family efflux transporter outer membrane factor (OMF) lipoprotein
MRSGVAPLAALLPVVSACVVGPRYRPPEVPVPDRWTEASGPTTVAGGPALERWWSEFRDPVLDGLVMRALRGNHDLKLAAARVREARAARGIAASAALPTVSVSSVYSRARRSQAVPPFDSVSGGAPFGPREQDRFEAGFDASWEIDLFGGVRRDKEAALADVQASEEARRDVRVTLLAEVARVYAELRGAQRRLDILDDTLRSQRASLALVEARFRAGLAAALDVSRAEGLLAVTEAERPVIERQARRSVHRLGVLLGQEPDALRSELERSLPRPFVLPEVPMTLPSELLSRRPDLRRAEREVAAATARVGVARADLFPRFAIFGAFGRLSEDASDLGSGRAQFWSLVPGFRLPIFSGGRIRSRIRVQSARQEQALLGYQKAVLIALEEVENALVGHARELRRHGALGEAVAAERRSLELATARYTGGLESFLSVLDAQRAVFAAENELARSETGRAVTLISVYKALGGGWPVGGTEAAP